MSRRYQSYFIEKDLKEFSTGLNIWSFDPNQACKSRGTWPQVSKNWMEPETRKPDKEMSLSEQVMPRSVAKKPEKTVQDMKR